MSKILSLILLSFFASCSAAYLDQYQGNSNIKLSVSYNTETNGIALAWDYPEESVRMEIFRGTNARDLQPIKAFLGQRSWLDASASVGTEYFYRVNAFTSQGRMVASSATLKGLRAYQGVSAPVPSNFHIELGSALSKISLRWIGSEGQSYRLYRSLSSDSGYHSIAVLTGDSYQDSSLTPDTRYYYKLSVIYQDASGAVQEKFYNSGSGDIADGLHIEGKTLSDTL